MDEDLQEVARALLAAGCSLLVRKDAPVEPALELMDAALLLSPFLRVHAWERGFALYYLARYEEAAQQFSACAMVDPDDVEPYLWRCMAEARAHGWEAAQRGLQEFSGYDRRLCMMLVLELFKGQATVEEVLASSLPDCHASQRASFAAALYHEARGEDLKALHLLVSVAGQAADGDVYMRELARCHLRCLRRRVAAQAVPRWRSPTTGFETPRVIRGGWQLASGHDTTSSSGAATAAAEGAEEEWGRGEEAQAAAMEADMQLHIEAGVTAVDCGDIYTGVECLIGRFLRDHRPTSIYPQPVQVHTKLVPDLAALARVDAAHVRAVVQRSLNRLHVESLDLVQFHWWDYAVPNYTRAALALQSLVGEGMVKHVGLTNFDLPRTRELMAAGVRVAAQQVQLSLLDDRPVRSGLVAHAEKEGIAVLAYGVLAGGFLTDAWLGKPAPDFDPSDPSSLPNRSLVKYRLIIEEWGGWGKFQGLLGACRRVADRHQAKQERNVTVAMVAVAYVLALPGVAAVILGARSAEHVRYSVRAATALALTEDDLQELSAAGAGDGSIHGDVYELERRPSSAHYQIMKRDLNAGLGGGPHCDELAGRFLDGLFRFFPHEATRAGVHRYNHLLPTPAPPTRLAFSRWAHRLLAELASLDPTRLDPDRRVDRRIMLQHLRLRLLHHTSRPRAQTAAEVAFELGDAVRSLLEARSTPTTSSQQEQEDETSSSSGSNVTKDLAARLLALPRVLLRDVAQDLRAAGPLPQPLARAARRAAKGLARQLLALRLQPPPSPPAPPPQEQQEAAGRWGVGAAAEALLLMEGFMSQGGVQRREDGDGAVDLELYARAAALASRVYARLLKAAAAGGDGDGGETTETETETEPETEEDDEGGSGGRPSPVMVFPPGYDAAVAAAEEAEAALAWREEGSRGGGRGGGGGGKRVRAGSGNGASQGETKGGKARWELGVGRERLGQYVALLYADHPWAAEGEDDDEEEEGVDGQVLLDAILRRAEARFAGLQVELKAAALQVDPEGGGDWQGLLEAVAREDTATISRPASPSNDTTTTTTTDPLLPLYLDAIAKAQAHVLRTGIVDLPTPSPTMPRVVGRVVPSGGGGNDVAVYMPAPFARDRSAVLVLQQPAPGSGSDAHHHAVPDRHSLEVLAAHHCFPGRYHQRLLALRHPRALRRWFRDARMEEGWAVVAEELGMETGFYSEPAKARLLLLRRHLHRAARCLLDARLHCGDWTFERCCAFLRDQGMCPTDEAAATEVLRYAQKPAYVMAPFLGYEALGALRREREPGGGEGKGGEGKVNLAAFHRGLLRHGAIPPACVAYLNAEEARAREREQERREGAIWI